MTKISYAIKLRQPDEVVVVTYDEHDSNSARIDVDPASVNIRWGRGNHATLYPWHRVVRIDTSET